MATITGVTKQKVDQMAGELIVGATKSGTTLVFTKANGGIIQVQNAFLPQHMNYAVGQILMTDRADNPATYMGGGTWVRWGKGRVPVGLDEADAAFDKVEELGGVKEVAITELQMPNHDHGTWTGDQNQSHTHAGYTSADGMHAHSYLHPNDQGNLQGGGGLTAADNVYTWQSTTDSGYHSHGVQTYGASNGHLHQISAQGGSQPHTNLQPYITCYMWKKTKDTAT